MKGRISGHKLTVIWNGEKGDERASTGTCECGEWEESASTAYEVRNEYRFHLETIREKGNRHV